MLLVDCVCARQDRLLIATRKSNASDKTHRCDFSHSDKAELLPEVALSNMGPSQWVICIDLGCPGQCCCWPEPHLRSGIRCGFTPCLEHKKRGQGLLPARLNQKATDYALLNTRSRVSASWRSSKRDPGSATSSTSSIVLQKCKFTPSSCSGVRSSSTFMRLSAGKRMSFTPARLAARNFSFTPPMGKTFPLNVSSPVIPVRGRTGV